MEEITIKKSIEYQEIAEELISTEQELYQLREYSCGVQLLLSDEIKQDSNKKLMKAEIERIPVKYSWATPAVFTITLFAPAVAYFSNEQIQILILRELLKIQIAEKGNGELKYSLRSYDLQDFRTIIDRFGADWDETELFQGVDNGQQDKE